jgi:hypothetical protein
VTLHQQRGSIPGCLGPSRIPDFSLRFLTTNAPLTHQANISPSLKPKSTSPGRIPSCQVLTIAFPFSPTSWILFFLQPRFLTSQKKTDFVPLLSNTISMKKTSSHSNLSLDRVRSWARTKAHGPSPLSPDRSRPSILPINHQSNTSTNRSTLQNELNPLSPTAKALRQSTAASHIATDVVSTNSPPPAPPPQVDRQRNVIDPETENEKEPKKGVALRFLLTAKAILFSSYINLLLLFVPVGIAAHVAHLEPGIVFGMNAIAIIPLAGLLSHATESVAKRMGDTVGALMNVTFGNAVELIILYASQQDTIEHPLTSTSMYVYLKRDQDKKEREALLKALSYQSRPISSVPSLLSHAVPLAMPVMFSHSLMLTSLPTQ